jgi:hypothetical protein
LLLPYPRLPLHGVINMPDYAVNLRQSTPGHDITCGQKDYQGNPLPYCRVSWLQLQRPS